MAEDRTIARPYAHAVFQLAREHNALSRWSEMLAIGTRIISDPALSSLIGNPRFSQDQLIQVVVDVAGDRLDAQGINFIRMLVENDRLSYLPDIADLFEAYRREAEHTVDAQVVTAYPLSEEQRRQIGAALQARLGQSVSVTETIDESLIGGIVIRIGDRVMDGSVTNQIYKLSQSLAG